MIWWVLPALAAVLGLMLLLKGLSNLGRRRAGPGVVRSGFGLGLLAAAGFATLAGLNMQTYNRLVHERLAATVTFEETGEPDVYMARVETPEGQTRRVRVVGDEFEIGARILKFKAVANMLGYDSIYRLDYISGRYADRFNEGRTEARVVGSQLSANPGLDVHMEAKKRGGRLGFVDARYGSAAYNPMADDYSYTVHVTQDALILRPANRVTRRALGAAQYPGRASAP